MSDMFIRKLKALVAELADIVEVTPSAADKISEINTLIDNYSEQWQLAEQDPKRFLSFPVPVQIKKEFFEDDWLEPGMRINLLGCVWIPGEESYKISYDTQGFDEYNERMMSDAYYPNDRTRALVREGKLAEKELYTAIEVGQYTKKDSSYLSPMVDGKWSGTRNDGAMAQTLLDDYVVIIKRG